MRNWLRGKLADAVCDSYAAENQKFYDEIERLRAALQAVSDFYGWGGDVPLGEVGNKVRKALMSRLPI